MSYDYTAKKSVAIKEALFVVHPATRTRPVSYAVAVDGRAVIHTVDKAKALQAIDFLTNRITN